MSLLTIDQRPTSDTVLGPRQGELTLRIHGTSRDGQVLRLAGNKHSIGSGEGCTVRIEQADLRPVHCYILRGAAGAVVRRWSPDTRLNGREFRDALLRRGDRLSVGALEFEVLADDDDQTTGVDSVVQDDARLQELTAEIERLEQQLRRHTQQFELESGAWHEERVRLEAALQSATDDLAIAANEMQCCRSQWESQKAELESLDIEKDQWQQRLAARQTDLDQLEQALADARGQLAEQTQQLAHEREEFVTWRNKCEEELGTQRLELRHHEEALHAQIEASHSDQHDKQLARQRELDQQQADIVEQHEALRGRDAELQAAQAELERRQVSLNELSGELARQRDAIAARQQATDLALQADRRELAESAARQNYRQAVLDQQFGELAQLRSEYEAAQARWLDREAQLCLKSESESHAAYEQQREELERQRAELDSARDELAQREAAVRCERDEWEAQREQRRQESAVEPTSDDAVALDDAVDADDAADAADAAEVDGGETAEARKSEAMLALERLRQAAMQEEDADDFTDDPTAADVAVDAEPFDSIAANDGDDSPPEEGPTDDVSIEDYMSQLMQRVQGRSDGGREHTAVRPTPAPPKPKSQPKSEPPKAKPPADLLPAAASDNQDKSDKQDKQDKAARLAPRPAAPEQLSNLKAMRELANQSARSALNTSSRRRGVRLAKAKIAMSAATIVCSGILLAMSDGIFTWKIGLSVAGFVAAGLFGWQGICAGRQAGIQDAQRQAATQSTPKGDAVGGGGS